MSESPLTNDETRATNREDEIRLLALALVLAKHKKIVLGVPIIATVLAAIISLMLDPIYTGTARILPPQQGQASVSGILLGQLSGLTGLANTALGLRNPNDLYIGMLRSRTVADNLISRFGLKEVYEAKFLSDARSTLQMATRFSLGKDGVITIDVEDKDRKRAVDLANAYVEELYRLTQVLAISDAAQRRLFFERQLEQARKNLTNAEIAARQGIETGGLVKVDDQGRAMVETTARLRGQIAVKEIQISAMRTFAAESNPELRQAQNELAATKQELAKIEGFFGGRKSAAKPGKTDGMESLGLLREVKYYETMYELLAKQYEVARIDEAREAPLVQVLDRAIEPDRRTKPRRTLMVILTAIVFSFISVLTAFLMEAMERVKADPEQVRRWRNLQMHLRMK